MVNHRQKDLDIIDLLCQFGAYNNIGDTLLTKAVKNSEKFKIQRLLDDKANINTTAANGWTSLMHATFLGKLDIVKDLVERGANINLKKQGRKKCVNDSNRKPLVRYRPVFIGERRQRLYKK